MAFFIELNEIHPAGLKLPYLPGVLFGEDWPIIEERLSVLLLLHTYGQCV